MMEKRILRQVTGNWKSGNPSPSQLYKKFDILEEVIKFFKLLFCSYIEDPREEVFRERRKAYQANCSQTSVGAIVKMEYHDVSASQYNRDRREVNNGLIAFNFDVKKEAASNDKGQIYSFDVTTDSYSDSVHNEQRWWKHVTRDPRQANELAGSSCTSFDTHLRLAANEGHSLSSIESDISELVYRQFRL